MLPKPRLTDLWSSWWTFGNTLKLFLNFQRSRALRGAAFRGPILPFLAIYHIFSGISTKLLPQMLPIPHPTNLLCYDGPLATLWYGFWISRDNMMALSVAFRGPISPFWAIFDILVENRPNCDLKCCQNPSHRLIMLRWTFGNTLIWFLNF